MFPLLCVCSATLQQNNTINPIISIDNNYRVNHRRQSLRISRSTRNISQSTKSRSFSEFRVRRSSRKPNAVKVTTRVTLSYEPNPFGIRRVIRTVKSHNSNQLNRISHQPAVFRMSQANVHRCHQQNSNVRFDSMDPFVRNSNRSTNTKRPRRALSSRPKRRRANIKYTNRNQYRPKHFYRNQSPQDQHNIIRQ